MGQTSQLGKFSRQFVDLADSGLAIEFGFVDDGLQLLVVADDLLGLRPQLGELGANMGFALFDLLKLRRSGSCGVERAHLFCVQCLQRGEFSSDRIGAAALLLKAGVGRRDGVGELLVTGADLGRQGLGLCCSFGKLLRTGFDRSARRSVRGPLLLKRRLEFGDAALSRCQPASTFFDRTPGVLEVLAQLDQLGFSFSERCLLLVCGLAGAGQDLFLGDDTALAVLQRRLECARAELQFFNARCSVGQARRQRAVFADLLRELFLEFALLGF